MKMKSNFIYLISRIFLSFNFVIYFVINFDLFCNGIPKFNHIDATTHEYNTYECNVHNKAFNKRNSLRIIMGENL